MLFQSSASKAKSDIDRYYGTCMGNNFSLKNLTLTGTMELVWVTTSHLKTNFSYVLGCMTVLFSTK